MLFKNGLTSRLHHVVLKKTPIYPTTLVGWQNAAHTQHTLCYGFVVRAYCMLSGSHDLTVM
jgi:hypothetical protein